MPWGRCTAGQGSWEGQGVGASSAEAGRAGEEGDWPGTLALTLPSVPLQCDRLAADCAQELRCHGVSYVSLWPGLVQTELLKDHLMKDDNTEDSLFNLVGKGRAREAEDAGESASPSSKTGQ